jgi:hypothetical protein
MTFLTCILTYITTECARNGSDFLERNSRECYDKNSNHDNNADNFVDSIVTALYMKDCEQEERSI